MTTLMQSQPRTKISYEEFLEWLNEERHAEWVDEEIIEMSPVSNQHQDVARRRIWTDSRKHFWKARRI